MIKFSCSECGKVYRVPDKHIGKRVRCKACGQVNALTQPIGSTLGNGDSIAAYNNLLSELAKAEKSTPALELEP
ncbi:MAG: zinc-ribbon domain-containing protein [Phycisphaerae bacterium]|nr:zinc-ribbon domain-containing protein [Phycisphaerae bacterium]